MELLPIKSSAITEAVYDADTQTLGIVMGGQKGKDNMVVYVGVPALVAAGLVAAPSAGQYYNREIRGLYKTA